MAGPDSEMIAWLGAADDPLALGGKGASLDRLVRMGFRVPPGFCVTTAAFRAQPSFSGSLLPATDAAVRAALGRLIEDLRDGGTGEPRFAVRSSAIGEDGTVASYAGLHETELDLEAEAVPAAITRCWASLWSPAALAYRERRGLPADDAAMAVVVQALVPADEAAVGFTRHPVTGRADRLVITAVRGLGDAMVAGTVTPDTYTVDRRTRVTLELERGMDPQGPALGADALTELVELMLAVEAGFGAPVDIEAARAHGTWYVLQARPITAMVAA